MQQYIIFNVINGSTAQLMPGNHSNNSKPQYDLVVIGAGPAGATTARFAAAKGLRVLLVDKKQELGAPIQCSGAVSHHALEQAGVYPSPEFVHEAIYGFAIYNTLGARKLIDYRLLKPEAYGDHEGAKPLGYVVDRRRFDRSLVAGAERAGAETWLKTSALGFRTSDDGSCEVDLLKFNENITVQAGAMVGADGVQSQVGKWAGIKTHIKLSELASCHPR